VLAGSQPNPWYNPYVTIDYLAGVPLRDASNPAAAYASRGKQQPYAADPSQVSDQAGAPGVLTQQTFGQPNNPLPPSGHYDWLVHLDRQLVSPMELLQVSGCQPHQLTQKFITGNGAGQRFAHLVPWFDQTRRLYRAFEFWETGSRVAGVAGGARLPGKINLNTVWDPEVLLALCDPQPGNRFTAADLYDPANPANPATVFGRMLALRTPAGTPGAADRPFVGWAAGYVAPGDRQYPRGSGIEDTLLRSFDGTGGRRLFQPDNTGAHPYVQYELLTKMFNNVTTRSNVFAVWVTVGFFEVTDDTARPVKLGAEIGRSENRQVRHRMFAILDRTALETVPQPGTVLDPRKDPVVAWFSILE
jgi:hypothetical protein